MFRLRVAIAYVHLLLFTATVGLAAAQENAFIYPPPSGSVPGDSGIVVTVGDTVNLTWKTTYTNITLRAWQFDGVNLWYSDILISMSSTDWPLGSNE